MNVTEISVRRPVTGVMVFLALTVLGVFTFSRLKLDMLPNIEFPMIAIITSYPGAGPESIELLVTRPIEDALASVKNVEDVNSTSNQGSSIVMVKFAWGTDMDQAEQDVRKNLEIYAYDGLPDDVDRPLTFAFDPAMQPVVFLAVNSPGTPESARKIAEDEVEPYLSRIPGVAAAEVIGGATREIHVRLLPEWLESYRIPVPQLVGALRGANIIVPGGMLEQGRQELNIQATAEFTSVDQIRDVVVGNRGGKQVLLRDVAEVEDGFQEITSVVRSNGESAVMLAVRKQSDANTVQVAQRVLKELKTLEKRLPEGVTLSRLFDQGEPISRSISNLSTTAVMAILLTSLVLLAFLRSWRTALIVLLSIPLSMLVTFAVMDSQDVTLNIISMAGLALAVGMLVDNSIVVLENIFTRLNEGLSPKDAAIQGTKEMMMPIVASTLTTVAVFAPILFVPGLAGQMFRDMSLTICISLISSLLVALTLVPLLASLVLHREKKGLFHTVAGWFTFWLEPFTRRYLRVLSWCLVHRKKALALTIVVFLACMSLGSTLGADFLAKTDEGHLVFDVTGAPGTSTKQTDEVFRVLESIIAEDVPEAQVVVSQFGGGEGFAALFGQNAWTGNIQVRLPPKSQRERNQFDIAEALLDRFKEIPGIDVKLGDHGAAMMGGGGGDVQVKLFSDDLTTLREFGTRLKNRLETVEGVVTPTFSMEQGRPELQVDLDRDQIRQLGLSAGEVASTISTYFLGSVATMYREGGDEFRVFVRAPPSVREDVEQLRNLPIVTPLGTVVPLSTVADIRQSLGPTAITRENQRRIGTVSMSASRGTPLGTLVTRVNEVLADIETPPGVTTAIAGAAEDLQESFMALVLALFVAVLLVYMVMASQFESLLEPFVILFSVPLAMAGVMVGLAATRTSLQVTALIGIILLSGVVVNNGIVLIDVLKKRREEGVDLIAAALEAGRSRMRPILMTSLTTILGMIPMALEMGDGAELWAPMGRAVIGGMAMSTVLTLVVIPTGYVSLAGWVDRRRARKEARRRAKEERERSPDAALEAA